MAHRSRQSRDILSASRRGEIPAYLGGLRGAGPTQKSKKRRSFSALFLVNPSYEDAFMDEALREKLKVERIVSGVFTSNAGGAQRFHPVFARQMLRDVLPVRGENPSLLAQEILDVLLLQEELGYALLENRLQLAVVLPDVERLGSAPLRPHALTSFANELQGLLEKKCLGRGVKKGLLSSEKKHVWVKEPRAFLQILLVDEREAWVERKSVHVLSNGETTQQEDVLGAWPALFPAGRKWVAFDAKAPSSAHRKFEEALAWLGEKPGSDDVVIDCGAAPGGWSYVALQCGAEVIAIDRGKMAPALLKNARLTHLRKDAFVHAPLNTATWLICDVIAEPEQSLALLQKTLAQSNIRACVLTLKLKYPIKWSVIEEAKASLLDAGVRWDIRNLVNNKLEVTVLFARNSDDALEVL